MAAEHKGWSRGWIKLIASGPYVCIYIYDTHTRTRYKQARVCAWVWLCLCPCTICPVVRKDKRKLIKKFLIRIFPLCIGFCLCVVGRKLIIGSFLLLSRFLQGYDVFVIFGEIVFGVLTYPCSFVSVCNNTNHPARMKRPSAVVIQARS